MGGSFACPECGWVVPTGGNTPGRRVRCRECGTLVEIPFLARGASRRSRRRPPVWIWPVIGLVGAVMMVTLAVKVAHSRGIAAREAEVASEIDLADKSETSGRFDEALAHAERALTIARTIGPDCRKPTQARRDMLAIKDAEARLSSAEASPDRVGSLRALQRRVDADPAMEPVRDRVAEVLAATLVSKAEGELSLASQALADGNPSQAMALCEDVAKAVDEVGRARAGHLREDAERVVTSTLGRFGVVFAPVTGEFLQGPSTARLHARSLHPIIANALKRKGYLPKPETSAYLALWDEASPFKVTTEVIEREDGGFFQTPLHTSNLRGYVALFKGTKPLWQARPTGSTRIPPPSMTAFEMSHITLAKQRDPAVEKRLYDDARAVVAEALVKALWNLPSP